MADLLVALMITAFFGVCVALVRGCERIIGPDEAGELEEPEVPVETVREPSRVAG